MSESSLLTVEESLGERETVDGCVYVAVTPAPNELFIDLDDDLDITFETNLEVLRHYLVVWEVRHTPSRTPGHSHVVLKVERDVTPLERIALQVCLGSDRKHELLSLLRAILNTGQEPTVFFEKESDVTVTA